MKSLYLISVALLFSSALSGQVFYENDLFSIYFPTQPSLKKEKLKSNNYTIKLYSLSSSNEEGRIFTVNYYEYPENTTNLRSASVAKSILESFAEQKKIESEEGPEVFNYKKHDGMELNGLSTIENKYYNIRVFLFRGYIIQLAIVSDKTAPHKKVVKNFFKGLSLINQKDH